ncbi:YybH family protein [Dyella agri]|uniref:Nuclear transport factor 2 family protein n=1 Tax=Dyella agri TaxID=1926869 RepID=A0ABW8KLN3_9GAMM
MQTQGIRLILALGCVAFAAAACGHDTTGRSASAGAMQGIAELHQGDVAATLSQDPDALVALWTKDGVLLGEGDRPVVGQAALRAAYAQGGWKVLKYAPHIQDVAVEGDSAVEWGRFEVDFQTAGQPRTVELHGRFLRAMRRQSDGRWRFTRIMWQKDPP